MFVDDVLQLALELGSLVAARFANACGHFVRRSIKRHVLLHQPSNFGVVGCFARKHARIRHAAGHRNCITAAVPSISSKAATTSAPGRLKSVGSPRPTEGTGPRLIRRFGSRPRPSLTRRRWAIIVIARSTTRRRIGWTRRAIAAAIGRRLRKRRKGKGHPGRDKEHVSEKDTHRWSPQ